MGTYGGEPGASQRGNNNAAARAPITLYEALAELRRLTRDPLADGVEQALADLGHAPVESGIGADTVRKLRQWSAEYQRVAIDLEAAARCCRLAEREISQRVDALLETSLAKAGRRSDRFRDLFRGRPVARRPEPVAAEPESASAVPVTGCPAPEADVTAPTHATGYPAPEADIAASALGPLEVQVAGRHVPRWNSLKARALFQYLLIHQDRPTRRDVLMALQWPDHSHESARNNLNVALYSLRSTLDGLGQGVQPILYRHGCYSLNPDLTWWIDRTEFLSAIDDARRAWRANRPRQVIHAYRKAIRLYRGPLFEDGGADEWFLPEQRRLKDLHRQALDHLAETHFELGELSEALQFGQLAISYDPCAEAMHRLLMRCYASQHQQQLVSRQYHVCVAALRDELDVPPSGKTTQLFRELT